MGQVVSIEAARGVKLSPDMGFIDAAYDALEALPSFNARPGQKALSKKIFEALMAGKPMAAEAPTGTGKTLAYLIAGLAAQAGRPDSDTLPLVIATATVGLQQQILTGDLPKLYEAKLLDPRDALIAKGRGRYLCLLSADRLMGQAAKEGQFDFFDQKMNDATQTLDSAKDMFHLFNAGFWPGDRDSYDGVFPAEEIWARLAASSDTCIGKRCAFYEQCPFFKDRAKLAKSRLIIANHDLVLADLKMAQAGEQDPLFPADKYLLVFDEAHNLPDKALNAGSAELDIEAAQASLLPLPAFAGKLFRDPDIAKMLHYKDLSSTDFEPGPSLAAMAKAAAAIRLMPYEDENNTVVRLGQNALPAELERALLTVHGQILGLEQRFSRAMTALRNSKLPDNKPALAPYFAEVLFQASFLGTRLKEMCSALGMFLSDTRAVRWLDYDAARVKLHVSPLEGADFLRAVLWQTERAVPILISATLRTFGNFDRFRGRSGLPNFALTHAVEPIFDYQKSNLIVATEMKHTPKYIERAAFEQEVSEYLPLYLREGHSTLVLFSSIRMMRKVVPSLKARFGEAVLAQGAMALSKLLQTHKERSDAHKTSILCGLATMAEGLDLPGHYCVHVVIVSLPFAVPTSPVERELQEAMGKQYFYERALPDTMTHLIQMVGRLIRRESDRGRITVMDKRLWETRWGQKMLRGLPPFKKRAERIGDRQVR
jgi:ATP-dependent DNA helicase DinG